MAQLVELTSAQLFTVVTAAGDGSGRIGRWTVDALVSYIQSLPSFMQPLTLAYNECVTLLTGVGLNPASLTDQQAADATYAMAFAAAYRLLLVDSAGATTLPAENFVTARQEFGQRVTIFYQLAGKHYDAVGVPKTSNPYYDYAKWEGSFDIVTRDDATQGYPYGNSFTTIP
jgi:hypothetical protein